VTYTTITDAYAAFSDLFGTEKPVWSRNQLQDWIHRHSLRYEDITDDLLSEAFDDAIAPDDDGREQIQLGDYHYYNPR
jgi:aminoglycoside phosphotransferase (APT) family kinase protein